MTSRRKAAELLLPWSGWIAALLGWAATQQIGSISAHDKCAAAGPFPMALLGLAGIAVLALGAFLSLKLRRRGEAESKTRRFLATVGLMLVAIVAAAVVWQTLAALIIPRCFG